MRTQVKRRSLSEPLIVYRPHLLKMRVCKACSILHRPSKASPAAGYAQMVPRPTVNVCLTDRDRDAACFPFPPLRSSMRP
jgi:hypothetical protein